jgi:hemerythrin-like domain-containing protein
MTATEDLRSEHGGVGRMLGIMDAMAGRMRAGVRTDEGELAQMIEFLRVFIDQCHHAKEEQLLFPALRTTNVALVEGTLDILTAEHATGREIVARIASAADRLSDEEGAASAQLVQAMAEYTKLLHAHIRREESESSRRAQRGIRAHRT